MIAGIKSPFWFSLFLLLSRSGCWHTGVSRKAPHRKNSASSRYSRCCSPAPGWIRAAFPAFWKAFPFVSWSCSRPEDRGQDIPSFPECSSRIFSGRPGLWSILHHVHRKYGGCCCHVLRWQIPKAIDRLLQSEYIIGSINRIIAWETRKDKERFGRPLVPVRALRKHVLWYSGWISCLQESWKDEKEQNETEQSETDQYSHGGRRCRG